MNTVSIITCTARAEPQFEWLADSICLCASGLSTQVGIEWIVVDACLWHNGNRDTKLRSAVRGRIPFKHIPPKPCRWQGPDRLTKENHYALCNARNTGLIAAEGKRVILLDDCTVVHPCWLERHLEWGDNGVAGAYCTFRSAAVDKGMITSGDHGPYGWDERVAKYPSPRLAGGAWGFGLNTSFPLDSAIAVNGFCESYDGQGGSEDCDFGIRMERSGVQYTWDPTCIIYQILSTHDAVFEHAAWGGREGKDQVKRAPKELVIRRDGKSHFANEALIERLVYDDIGRTLPLGNCFRLDALRAQYRKSGSMKHEALSEIDWRDGALLAESDKW